MDEPERKRRGPLTWLASKATRFRVAVVIAVPVLYVFTLPLETPALLRQGWIEPSTLMAFKDKYEWPLEVVMWNSPDPVAHWIIWHHQLLN